VLMRVLGSLGWGGGLTEARRTPSGAPLWQSFYCARRMAISEIDMNPAPISN